MDTQTASQRAGVVSRGRYLVAIDGEHEVLLNPTRACALCWDMVPDYKFIDNKPYCVRDGEFDVSCYDVVS